MVDSLSTQTFHTYVLPGGSAPRRSLVQANFTSSEGSCESLELHFVLKFTSPSSLSGVAAMRLESGAALQ
jgi:hypothetical protein